MSLAARIAEILAIEPSARAVEFEDAWRSWGDLASAATAIDEALNAAGLGPDARVGVLLRNHASIVPAVLAVLAGERCLVTLNPVLPADKLAQDVLAIRTPAVIGLRSDVQPLAAELEAAGCLVLALESAASGAVSVVSGRRPEADHAVFAEGVAIEMLTSGTTGAPKRLPMRRAAFESAVFAAARFEAGRSDGDKAVLRSGVQLLMAPFAHIGGLLALMNAIAAGRSSVLLPKFAVAGFRQAVSRYGVKVASAPPAALKMILDAGVPKTELQSLRAFRSGTAPLDPDLGDAFYETYGIPVLQNYGATEFGGVAGWTLPDFHIYRITKRGSVGRLNPGVDGRVVDAESGHILSPGEPGVLELKAKQIGDGESWLRTTDLARLDADGFLFIVGRADNVIIRGGFKIQPDDLVRAAESHPGVREAAVVAVKDERLGQVPVMAFVGSAGGAAPGPEALKIYLRERLSPYQVPSEIFAVPDLPRTPSLKVDQTSLRRIVQELA